MSDIPPDCQGPSESPSDFEPWMEYWFIALKHRTNLYCLSALEDMGEGCNVLVWEKPFRMQALLVIFWRAHSRVRRVGEDSHPI